MNSLNPYEQLGVQRDASERLIRDAYRKKAKTHHPDANPDADPTEWEKTSTALAVLTDPKRRKTFDETGQIEPEAIKPDNARAAALTIVEMHIAAIVNEFATSGFSPSTDPRKMDVPLVVVGRIQNEIAEARIGIAGGQQHILYLKDLARRFKLKNPDDFPAGDPIVRGFDAQVQRAEQQCADLKAAIAQRELAIQIAAGYVFERDTTIDADAYHRGQTGPYSWRAPVGSAG